MKEMVTVGRSAGLLAALVLGAACACTSEVTPETAMTRMLGVNITPLAFRGMDYDDEGDAAFAFSRPVKLIEGRLNPAVEAEYAVNNNTVTVALPPETPPGTAFTADILVEDADGNTFNLVQKVRSFNNRVPRLVINEVRAVKDKDKCEFLEFKTLGAGNLGALRVFSAASSLSEPVYEFPPVDVAAGEYIVLHLRSSAPKLPDGRQFWVASDEKIIHKSGALWISDQREHVRDALVFCGNQKETGTEKTARESGHEFLVKNNAWTGDALDLTGEKMSPTASRTICRNEERDDSDTASDWYISFAVNKKGEKTSSGLPTPGRKNAPMPQ